MASQPVQPLTLERYLEIERAEEERHEFVDGEMVAMSGGSPRHSIIGANISARIKAEKRGSGCVTFGPDLKVCVDQKRMIAYPDITVVCGKPDFLDAKRDVVKNPILLVEVLSPSTKSYDRGKKATHYRLLPSLQEFLLVEQEPVFIEHHRRMADGTWQVIICREADALIRLDWIRVDLPVAMIYEDLELY